MGRETMHSEQLMKEVFLVFNSDQEKEFKEQRHLSHLIPHQRQTPRIQKPNGVLKTATELKSLSGRRH